MDWSIGTFVSIGLRILSNRAEIERVTRKVLAQIAQSKELFAEVQALLDKIVPGLLSAPTIEVQLGTRIQDNRGVVHQYDVKWVQMALNHLMHPTVQLEIDGRMGDITRMAIENYQQSRQLTVDGWLGPLTMAQLDADIRKSHAGASR